jgi:ribosome-binding factor A
MGRGHRSERLGEEIKKIISEMLIRGLKDPRLSSMVSITAVEVTSDGSYATVFVSVLGLSGEGKEEAEQDTLDALKSAKGYIRNEISRQIKLRHTPDLIFKLDKSMEYGRHISEIIDTLDIKHDDDNE